MVGRPVHPMCGRSVGQPPAQTLLTESWWKGILRSAECQRCARSTKAWRELCHPRLVPGLRHLLPHGLLCKINEPNKPNKPSLTSHPWHPWHPRLHTCIHRPFNLHPTSPVPYSESSCILQCISLFNLVVCLRLCLPDPRPRPYSCACSSGQMDMEKAVRRGTRAHG